jgi:eukaryotic-like serine/threonine-protein kinase
LDPPDSPGSDPSADAPGPVAGELFAGRYRVERLLGRGAMGAVWAAHDEEVGDRVALKLLAHSVAPGSGSQAEDLEEAEERFRREVRLARRVTHRNAARVFDLGAHRGALYLTMELVDGEILDHLARRRAPLQAPEVAEIGRQIALGLEAAHQVGVVHRDLKPGNVLVDREGRVVLTDFGLARATAGDPQLTRGQLFAGTPSYMAPEQVRGQEAGPGADLYALGAVLFELLTGRPPFARETPTATALARLEEDPPDPRTLVEGAEPLAALVTSCLARDPARRPGSASAVASALAALAGVEGLTRAPETSAADTAPTLLAPGPLASTRSFASGSGPGCSLAVLPFRQRGGDADGGLADGVVEELTDSLSMTRGVRVTAAGATARYRGTAFDPRQVGAELGVDAIVDGTVQISGERARVSVRLIDVATGRQLWVGRFDDQLDDPFESQTTFALRVAEGLRVELELAVGRLGVPDQAVDLYQRARMRIEAVDFSGASYDAALELLDRALGIAPDFPLALAAHAEIAVRRWVAPVVQGPGEHPARAQESVRRALELASHLPLSHYAAGRLAVSRGEFAEAARELGAALEMAPTFAAVHDFLGGLQCEAGRSDDGVRHVELGARIDPQGLGGYYALARWHALRRDVEAFDRVIAELRARPQVSRFLLEVMELRVGSWLGDLERVRRSNPAVFAPAGHAVSRFMETMRAALLGESSPEEMADRLAAPLDHRPGPRLEVFIRQLAIEVLVPTGAHQAALEQLRLAAGSPVFVDADWLELCPALDPLRASHDLAPLVAEVRRRADAIWRAR